MNIFQKSDEFDAWLAGMKDHVGKAQLLCALIVRQKATLVTVSRWGEGVRR